MLGYACIKRFHERAAYFISIETSIYLNHMAHGKGMGKMLYETLFEHIKKFPELNRVYAGISYPND